jgi:RecA/RadA recombinase
MFTYSFPPALGLRTADEFDAARPALARLPLGIAPLDRLLDGGLPRGGLVEVFGRGGCWSLGVAALAAATARGETAALVDLGDQLDPARAEAAGVTLSRLLWLRPGRLRPALAAAEMALQAGFGLVVLDIGVNPVHEWVYRAAWMRLARAARAQRAALLVLAPRRMSGTQAAVVLRIARARALWTGAPGPRLLAGLILRLQPVRGGWAPLDTVEFRLAG